MTRSEFGMVAAVVAFVVLTVGGACCYEYKHPCLRYGPHKTCQTVYCSLVGKILFCNPMEVDCTECLERRR